MNVLQRHRRHRRGRPPHPDVLTPAEWRVLEPLREGASNAEIAERLGLSVPTVKSHVSSMLAKLEVRDRVELARWEGQPAVEAGRARRAPIWLAPLQIGGAVVGAFALGAALWAALDGGRDGGTPAPTDTPTTAAGAPTASATAVLPPGEFREVTGLFTEPRAIPEADAVRIAPERPVSEVAWDGQEVVLFDLETDEVTSFGPGRFASFSPDGTWLAWSARVPGTEQHELAIVDLASGVRREAGHATMLGWRDDDTLLVRPFPGSDAEFLVDAPTGTREPAPAGLPVIEPPPVEAGRWRLTRVVDGDYPLWRSTYEVDDLSGALPPLRFDAHEADLAADGTLFIATVPDDQSGPPTEGPHLEWGTTNLFAVEPESGAATYLASAVSSAPNWSFDVSAERVAWMEGFCANPDQSQVRTRILDRDDGTITEVDEPWWLSFIRDGRLALGAFGRTALVSADTLEYEFVAPEGASRVEWSPDYRYAAISQIAGSGGPC